MKAACVILAAGKGTRMRSRLPKVLHPVCGEPMITYSVDLALRRNFEPVVVVVSKQGAGVRDFLSERFPGKILFAVQDPPLGTGHAVMSAGKLLASHCGKLAILYGDVPLIGSNDITALKRAASQSAVAFLSVRLEDPTGYGRVVRGARGEVLRIVEQTDATPEQLHICEVNAGVYLVDAPFIFEALQRARRNNAQGEVYLTDLIEQAQGLGLKVKGIERKDALNFRGVNSRLELAQAEAVMNRRLMADLMRSGVTITDPDSTWVGPQVRIGADTMILPNCLFRGKVEIGSGCLIGPGTVIQNAKLGARTHVLAYSVIEDGRIGEGARIGPFARIRPGTQIGSEAQVGNFVEIKKTKIGRGSKANHLSYLGDATVGVGVNIGAGTITCNYDGVNKHPTCIDDGVFIGSDTQLVAPVKVGKRAVVGAGTTVTSDVPEDALAVSRVAQKNISGYARLRRRRLRQKSKKTKSLSSEANTKKSK